MTTPIRQEIGFDVTDAIANLDLFGKAISKTSNRLSRFARSLEKFNQATGTGASGLTHAGSAAQQLTTTIQHTNTHIGRLTTSMELLSRIVYTQLVIKGLRHLEMGLFEITKRAAELETQFARVRTISGDMFRGTAEIDQVTRSLSAELGIDQLKITEGLYQSISNQVKGTKEQIADFNKVVGQFSIATFTDYADAVDLLSGVLNSYSLNVDRAEELASKFNKTMELGRITGPELASAFGRVDNQAALLGVTLEEVMAAFATLTISGIDAAEAATLLRGVFTGLSKPTTEMKRVLAELNVPSAQFLIQSQGLANALQMISSRTDGSAAAIAKLFPNIRGLNGQLILGVASNEKYAQSIKEIENTATSLNKQRFDLIMDTDAKKVEKELNGLRLELRNLGNELLQMTASAFQFAGGAENIAATIRSSTPLLMAWGLQITASRIATNEWAKSVTLLGTNLSRLGTIAARVFIGYELLTAGVNLIRDWFSNASLAEVRQIQKARASAFEAFQKSEQKRLEEARKTDAAIVRSTLAAAEQQTAIFNAANSRVRLQEKSFVASTEGTLNRIVSLRSKLLHELESAAQDSANAIIQSQNRVQDLEFTKETRNFENRISRLSEQRQAAALLTRGVELARKASRDLINATNQDQRDRALRLFDTASSTAEQARSIASRLENRKLESRAVATLNTLTDRQIAAERQLQRIEEARRKSRERDADAQRRLNQEVQAQVKIISENLSTAGLSDFEVGERRRTLSEAFQKLTETAFSRSDVSLADSIGLAQLAADIERTLGSEVKLQFEVDEGINQIQRQLKANFDQFKVQLNFDVSQLEAALGKTFTTPDEIAAGLSQAIAEADELRTEISQAQRAIFKATNGAREEILALLRTSDSVANIAGRLFTGLDVKTAKQGTDLLNQFRSETNRILTEGVVNQSDIQTLFSTLKKLQDIVGNKGSGFGPDMVNMISVLEQFRKMAAAAEIDVSQQEARLKQLDSVIRSTGTVSDNLLNAMTRGSSEIRSAADYLADRISGATQSIGRQPQGFATGGLARGTDTVPAMLTPGEVVMNRNASQRFFSDLSRMNAGMKPLYRQAGGTVDNSVTVGDIHIHGGKPNFSARDVARELQREIRRGTIRRS